MGRWAREKGARNWHFSIATSSPIYRKTACHAMLKAEVILDVGAYPPLDEHWCRSCLQVASFEEQAERESPTWRAPGQLPAMV